MLCTPARLAVLAAVGFLAACVEDAQDSGQPAAVAQPEDAPAAAGNPSSGPITREECERAWAERWTREKLECVTNATELGECVELGAEG